MALVPGCQGCPPPAGDGVRPGPGAPRAALLEVLRQVADPSRSPSALGSVGASSTVDHRPEERRKRGVGARAAGRVVVVPRLAASAAELRRPRRAGRGSSSTPRALEVDSSRRGRFSTCTGRYARCSRRPWPTSFSITTSHPEALRSPGEARQGPLLARGGALHRAGGRCPRFDPHVPEDRRTLYAIELLGGSGRGEAAARRWRDWDEAVAPLGSLLVATSFDSRTHTEGPTKTRRPRRVPVHPALPRC